MVIDSGAFVQTPLNTIERQPRYCPLDLNMRVVLQYHNGRSREETPRAENMSAHVQH
jgi:hypothetical protein